MDLATKAIIWQQFGAAIDTLDNAIVACPDEIWGDRTRQHEYWYMAYHTIFWLDFYLSDSPEGFAPPAPFGLEEMDPAGVLPDRVYSKEELLRYLDYGRQKCHQRISNLTDEQATALWKFGSVHLSGAELLLYSMRHVQHHAAQLNLLLRQSIDSAPRWVFRAKVGL